MYVSVTKVKIPKLIQQSTMQQDILENSSKQDDSKILNHQKHPEDETEGKAKAGCQTLLDLPLELQAKIFEEYLDSNDQFQIRRVHSHFQVLLDDYIGFSVTIDEDDGEKLDFLSEVAIRKATIANMSHLKDTVNGQLKPPVFDDVFLYPQYVQSILMVGNIEHDFLSEMIRKCKVVDVFELSSASSIAIKSKEHREVEILPEIDVLSLEPAKISYFPRCRILKLLLKDTIITSSREVHTDSVLKIMKSAQSPFLERVVMQCWTTERFPVSRISLISAECLERNPSIRSYFVGILYDQYALNDGENIVTIPQEEQNEELRAITLSKFKKASHQMTVEKLGISTTSADMGLWKEFIKYQTNLVHISLTVDLEDVVFSNELFLSCHKTLKQFVLRGKFLIAFDFLWIEDCKKLKEICLHNINEGDLEGPSVHAVNVSSVPKDVESLVLFQTTARTDEINSALRKLTKLNTLVLFKTGNTAGETGIDPVCLKHIFRLRTLQSLLLVRFVASNSEQAAELVKIMQDMNYNRGHNLFGNEVVESTNDQEEDVPPLVAIEDLGAASSNEFEVVEKISKPIQEVFHEDTSPKCALRKCSSNINNNTNSRSNMSSVIADPERPQENGTEEPTTCAISKMNDLNGCCAMALPIPTPAHKMEPNLLTDTADSKRDEREEEGASYYPKPIQEAENLENPPKITDQEQGHDDDAENIELSDPSKHISLSMELDINPIGDDEVIDEDWDDMEDSDSDDDDESLWEYNFHDPGFVVGMDNDNDIGLDVIGQAENGQNFQLVLNLENEEDLENMLGLLEPIGDDNNNVAFGFILDGVIDIMNTDTKRSRWVAVEDDDGHLTYTLKITID